MNHPEEITKTSPNCIIKWVLKERQHGAWGGGVSGGAGEGAAGVDVLVVSSSAFLLKWITRGEDRLSRSWTHMRC